MDMAQCREHVKPIILSHGWMNKRLLDKVEIVPIFLQKKGKRNKFTLCNNTIVADGPESEHSAIIDSIGSVDMFEFDENKQDSFVDSMKRVDSEFEVVSDLDQEFENLEYNEIIVTVEDVHSTSEMDNCLDDYNETNLKDGHHNATIKIHEKGPKMEKETYKCVEESCFSHVFSSYRLFRDHYITVHGKYPLECIICGKRYKEKHSLQNHLEMHSGEEKYPCQVCQKRFKTKERLLVHSQLHQGRRFSCECGFKARCQRSLRKHTVMKHGKRKFGCNFCRKTFASRQNLDAHVRIHTGVTPWECNLCESKFNRLHHFRQHLGTNLHIKMINELVSHGKEIPHHLNPEKNVPRKREIIEVVPVCEANEKVTRDPPNFDQNEKFNDIVIVDMANTEISNSSYPVHLDEKQSFISIE